MQFTVRTDEAFQAPAEIRQDWLGQLATRTDAELYSSDERAFLSMFGVNFTVRIPSRILGLESGTGAWIPQAYSTSESER